MTEKEAYFKYWGKARKEGEEGVPYHLLPYHCLNVAAVGEAWWEGSLPLQRAFTEVSGLSLCQTKAWLLFFIALHDYGKLDMRFQLKAPSAVAGAYPGFDRELTDIDGIAIKGYFHGPVGFSLFYHDFHSLFVGQGGDDQTIWEMWQPWLSAVTGHHGVIPCQPGASPQLDASQADVSIIEHDKTARLEWVAALEALFLEPVGLSLKIVPPPCSLLLAGFCSVADWLGSSSAAGAFEYRCEEMALERYYQQSLTIARRQLEMSGLLSIKQAYQGISALLPKVKSAKPRQLQTVVDQLPLERGLTLIEAPTGSGKTETALAYAWRLLAEGLADSIIFALPTQATANAMLTRLKDFSTLLFGDQPNLVLAHGKASFNEAFWQLKENYQQRTEQGSEEARVQCAEWLSTSRKRVFLGQIGVCTIDQVLISVLPVRHKFVRGFGVGKSILIVDEVHAYDSYMYGLLGEVLKQQQAAGGSALLLSATLPFQQRSALSNNWGGVLSHQAAAPYPLVTHVGLSGRVATFELTESELPEERMVAIEVSPSQELLPNDELVRQMIAAAKQGAQVVFICNLVDVAQGMARQLREQSEVMVDLFHARYRFCDRQKIEQRVMEKYGKRGERKQGAILIATQVVEQSLDLDFDWMITQLCPVDLLFQRLGRLHRHQRSRPVGFEHPKCTVLIPDNEDYGHHGLIYGNTRVLWRTAQMLLGADGTISFPNAYREWIEKVYQEENWGDEPAAVLESYDEFIGKRFASRDLAKMMINSEMSVVGDTDENVSALTRDGEMSLNVLPVIDSGNGLKLLEGDHPVNSMDEWWRDEALNLNMVSVPKSWRFLPDSKDGLITLPMRPTDDGAIAVVGKWLIRYSENYGLEKEDSNG